MLKEERDNLNENLKILTTIKLISWNWWSSSLIFCFLSVGNHVDAVEAARFKRNRGLTKVKKASRMLADSMAEVSMYAKPFSAANWAAVDSSISLRSKRSALLPIIPQKILRSGFKFYWWSHLSEALANRSWRIHWPRPTIAVNWQRTFCCSHRRLGWHRKHFCNRWLKPDDISLGHRYPKPKEKLSKGHVNKSK